MDFNFNYHSPGLLPQQLTDAIKAQHEADGFSYADPTDAASTENYTAQLGNIVYYILMWDGGTPGGYIEVWTMSDDAPRRCTPRRKLQPSTEDEFEQLRLDAQHYRQLIHDFELIEAERFMDNIPWKAESFRAEVNRQRSHYIRNQ